MHRFFTNDDRRYPRGLSLLLILGLITGTSACATEETGTSVVAAAKATTSSTKDTPSAEVLDHDDSSESEQSSTSTITSSGPASSTSESASSEPKESTSSTSIETTTQTESDSASEDSSETPEDTNDVEEPEDADPADTEWITLPDVVGMYYSDAQDTLDRFFSENNIDGGYNIAWADHTLSDDSLHVFCQEPAAGTLIDPRETLYVMIGVYEGFAPPGT